jgi:CBS domain-containing protein
MTQITARDFMIEELITLRPRMDVLEAVQLLLEHGVSGAPVVDSNGRYLGVFSEECSMQVLLDAAYEELPVTDVASFMDAEAQTIGPDAHMLSVAQVFLLTPYRRLPVLDNGRLVGMVSRRDVLNCWMKLLECDCVENEPIDSRATLVQFTALFAQQEAPLA